MTVEPVSSSTITVFTRHSADCARRDEPQWKRCNCRKSLYIRENGKTTYVSAKTRSWEQAERFAQAERDKRDPVKVQLQKIAEAEMAKAEASAAKLVPLKDAFEQWLTGMKKPGETSVNAYRSTTRRILRWAERIGIVYVSDVTPAALDKWRGSWAPDATDKANKLALTTQAALLTRLKAFFKWTTGMNFIERNPTLILKPISPEESQTWPLTPKQFDELLKATYKFDAAQHMERARVGQQLRAVFLVQRWTGLRVGDVLILPKSALNGNRLTAVIRKKRNRKPKASVIERVLPDHVVKSLNELPFRNEEHRDCWFWSKTCSEEVNCNKWLRKIDKLNDHLSFKDEDGNPLRFRSHMLRDTFAVEMLLAGVPIEKVSKLLTHESVTMTERYYAKWTKARKEQLEDEAIAAMRKQGVKVTTPGAPAPKQKQPRPGRKRATA
jgi:site-specific recombinase XerD